MTHRLCPLPADAREPGFLRALEPETMRAFVQDRLCTDAVLHELRPDYVRWKERDGSLVGYRAVVRRGEVEMATYVTARTAAPHRLADEAERLGHRADEDHAGLRAFAFVPDADLLLLAFPIDRALGDLRRLVRASKLRSLVLQCCPELVATGLRISKSRSTCRIVRYKPERRAVLHWDLALVDDAAQLQARRSLWVRCYAESRASRTQTATAAAARAGVAVPRPLGLAHERLLLESHLDGVVWQPFAGAVDAAQSAAAAAVVARLHDAPLPAALPQHGPLAELDLVLRAVEDLERLDPELGWLAAQLADRLAHDVPLASPSVLAHGDLHPAQILLDGGAAGLCDFDRACIAPVALDLATLHAHCVAADPQRGEAVAARFVADYARHRALPAAGELAWWTACALLRCATTPFRALHGDWPARARVLLARAAAAMPGASWAEGAS